MRRIVSYAVRVVFGIVFLGLAAAPAGAQTGRLIVTVVDPTGAALPNAKVTLTGLENATKVAAVAPATANDRGLVTFAPLALGRYSVTAEFAGFETGVIKEVNVRTGDNRQTLALRLRSMQESVTVGRNAQEAAADRALAFGTALTREQIDALPDDPTEMRRQILALAGGDPAAQIFVDSFEGGELPPKSLIKSIRVTRDVSAAENHSRNTIRIDVITQAGAGPFRGQVGTTIADSALDGRNPLVRQRPPSQNRFFNGSASGTLIENRMSFTLSGSRTHDFSTPVRYASTPNGLEAGTLDVRSLSRNSQATGAFDYALTRDQTLRGSANVSTSRSDGQGVGGVNSLERAFSTTSSTWGFRLQEAGPLGRRFFMNSRVGFSAADDDTRSASQSLTLVVGDDTTYGGAQRTGGTHTRSLTIQSDIDYVRGTHAVRFGAQYDVYAYRTDAIQNYLGTYTFESIEAFEAGQPRSFTKRIGEPNINYRNMQLGLYVQDDIRLRRSLTITPGVRYEKQDLIGSWRNFAPRVGATWAPFASGRTSLRASVGLFYIWLPTATYEQALRVDGVRQQEINIQNPTYPEVPTTGFAPPSNRYVFAQNLPMSRDVSVATGVSQRIGTRLNVTITYSYLRAFLFAGRNLNAPVNGARPDSRFANVITAVPEGRRHAHFFVPYVSLPLGSAPTGAGPVFSWKRGLLLSGNYALGSVRDNIEGTWSTPPTTLEENWGPTNGSVRHRVNASINTGAVRDLSISIGLSASSAPPVDIRTGFDDNGDLIFNDRPPGVGRNSAHASSQFTSNASVTYSLGLARRQVTTDPGISITANAGALTATAGASQSVPRYRLLLSLYINNLTNHPNLGGHTGVVTSPNFLKPTYATGVRTIRASASLTF